MSEFRALLAFSAAISLAAPAQGRQPPRDILGIHLGMPVTSAHKRLNRLGRLEREEHKRQEVWRIHDKRFRALLVGFDEQGEVRYVTAVARNAGSSVRYRDLLDTKAARHGFAGLTHTYVWSVRPHGRQPFLVIAIGNSPDFATYYSLKREADEDEDEEE